MDKFTSLEGVAAPVAHDQCRHRHDHPQAVPEDHQAHRARQGPVLRDALQRRRHREPGFRAQQAGLSQRQGHRGRRQFRLRLVARARALGAVGFRHPLRDLHLVRRHFLQQLLQERHSADPRVAGGPGEAVRRRRARRQFDADRRSGKTGNPRARRRRGQVRDRRLPQALPAQRARRYRADQAEGRQDRDLREAGRERARGREARDRDNARRALRA